MPQDEKSSVPANGPANGVSRLAAFVPGVLLCIVVAVISAALEAAERHLFAHPYVEALVLAILLGMAVRSFWNPSARWHAGIAFSAKQLLEVAVMLLGASISFAAIAASGAALLGAIAATVVATLAFSFGISRMLGLPTRLSILIACGNSICGNSAIAAVAPVIGANSDDVAASIGFTAVLGVAVVLALPLLGMALHMDGLQYGALTGLTVYAVPQVIAAATPIGPVAVEMGTLVKLVRVLMLGPVCLLLSLVASSLREEADERPHVSRPARSCPSFHHLVPWFILGFLLMMALRSLDLLPHRALAPMGQIATLLTVVSMAALGLGVDIRAVASAGGRVIAAVLLSLLVLGGMSLVLIQVLHIV